MKPGDRVRILHPLPILAMRSHLGILDHQEDSGYWIVRLDAPADYLDSNGDTQQMDDIRVSEGNLVALGEMP